MGASSIPFLHGKSTKFSRVAGAFFTHGLFWYVKRASDFEEYARQFPKGAHAGEAGVIARRLKKSGQSSQSSEAPGAGTAGQAAALVAERRFPVAHKHTFSWCYGYLVVGSDSVRFEVAQPVSDKGHGFTVKPSDVRAEQWTVLGNAQNGIELTAGAKSYILVWLADSREVQSGGAHRLTPPLGLPPFGMLTALTNASLAPDVPALAR